MLSGEETFFPGICEEFAGGAIQEEASSPGFFGIRLIRHRRRPPVVRNMRAVLKKASYGTRRIFKGTRCRKPPPVVRDAFSSKALGANLSHLNQENTRPIVWRRRIRPYFRAGSWMLQFDLLGNTDSEIGNL